MKISNRQQALVIGAAAVFLLLVADRVVFTPLARSWRARNARINELRSAVSSGDLLLQREQSIRGRWDYIRANALPNNVSAAESKVLNAFNDWAQQSHVTVTSIRPQWRQARDKCTTLECNADVQGSLAALARFLYEVEKDPLALKLENVELTARDNEGQKLSLGLRVSGLLLEQQKP
jgi:Tfp pilus assembly protein PilO